MTDRIAGKVKWFNSEKAFGFIVPNNGDGDVFVHLSAVEKAGLSTLVEGQSITFRIDTAKNGRKAAVDIELEK